MFLQGLLAVAGVIGCMLAVGAGTLYLSVRAKELPVETARSFIQLEPGDQVLHAYTGTRWLDSQRYFVVKADPAGFEARIKKLSGAPPAPEARVTEGPGKDLWHRTEAVPGWWDVDALESAIAVDLSSKGRPHSGSLSIFSKDRGLIYILDR